MSLFGTSFPAATAPTAFSSPFNFGTQSATTATTQQPNALGAFGSPFAATTAAPTAGVSFGAFGQAQQSQLQQPLQPQVQPTLTQASGLGGARTDVNLSGIQANGPSQSVRTPKETDVPQGIMAIVEMLKHRIKENRDLSEEIATVDSKMLDQLEANYRSACADYTKAQGEVQRVLQTTRLLRAESRQDLLDGEMAQRLRDSLAINFDYGAPLNYLARLATNYEKQLNSFGEELQSLEKLIFGQHKPVTSTDISTHLQRVDSAIRYMTVKVYELDKKVQELKESFKVYRRSVYGDHAKFFPASAPASKTLPSRFDRIEGPSPFSASSNSALLVIANALSRAQAGTGLVPNIGLPMQQQQLTFGAQPLLGFGLQQQTQPFSTTQQLFRPFGTGTTATTAAAVTPFASGALSFTNPLGAATTTSTATTTAAATTASPWRFSSPFNTSSSGTLFGGTATNVGAVKPLGLATPLQQGATPSASLQLLNPPLGSKRGKS